MLSDGDQAEQSLRMDVVFILVSARTRAFWPWAMEGAHNFLGVAPLHITIDGISTGFIALDVSTVFGCNNNPNNPDTE